MDFPLVAAASELYQLQRDYAQYVRQTVSLISTGSLDACWLADLSGIERSLA